MNGLLPRCNQNLSLVRNHPVALALQLLTRDRLHAVKVPRPDWKFGEPNQFLRAQVWDTAGQERYQAISSSHYRRAHGAFSSQSFEQH